MIINNSWQKFLDEESEKPYYRQLKDFITKEYETQAVYPPMEDIFNAYKYTPLDKVKVLILGQDPYHEEGQAHGLCFSVNPQVALPPSLVNIYKELNADLGLYIPNNGYLKKWADQGVMLLNSVLSVRAHDANSHANRGWEEFTDATIRALNEKNQPVVFMLWGKSAQKKMKMITNKNHMVLCAAHPSPLSAYRGFFGCRHFSQANDFLKRQGLGEIDWQIENIEV